MDKLGMLPDPFEHFQACDPRHFDVQQNERGQGETVAVGIDTCAGEVSYSFFAILDVLQIEMGLGAAGGSTQELDVIGVIINVQDGEDIGGRGVSPARNAARSRNS